MRHRHAVKPAQIELPAEFPDECPDQGAQLLGTFLAVECSGADGEVGRRRRRPHGLLFGLWGHRCVHSITFVGKVATSCHGLHVVEMGREAPAGNSGSNEPRK
jgi:hypothetical protein